MSANGRPVPGEFALKPRWVADKVPYSGFANGSYPTWLAISSCLQQFRLA